MIYTNGLDQETRYILVYQMNTPQKIVYLRFRFDDTNEQAWIDYVSGVLDGYAETFAIPRNELSARPIQDLLDKEL